MHGERVRAAASSVILLNNSVIIQFSFDCHHYSAQRPLCQPPFCPEWDYCGCQRPGGHINSALAENRSVPSLLRQRSSDQAVYVANRNAKAGVDAEM